MAMTAEQWARAKTIKQGMVAGRSLLSDAEASQAPGLYPVMQYSGLAIEAGTIINWEGQLKRAASTLWDREEHDPVNAPTLWEDIAYRDGVRIIPDEITSTTAFALDELGYWRGSDAAPAGVYKSGMAGNVFTPGTTGAPWEWVRG